MATSDYLDKQVKIYKFSQYTQTTVSAFSTQFNTDWASVLGGTVQLLATSAQPLQAIFIVPNSGGQVFYLNNAVPRTPTDGVTTNLSTTVTSATAFFNQSDVGASITGTGIQGSTTIVSVTNATTAVLSSPATASAGSISLTITRVGGDYIGYNQWVGWQVIPAWQMSSIYTATAN
ncbi:MAG TPA: hypothetical protein VGH54_27960 [Mycobacterium sp.]|uniref:hypothetical protein n=1 Tax=Mycobacterium sp. TaxID=1785 RepID=UPI002F401010